MAWELNHHSGGWDVTTTASSLGDRPDPRMTIIGSAESEDSNGTVIGRFDRQSRLHSVGNLPGLEYSDGRREWHWHGVQVPQHVVCEPHLITVEEIDAEENSEARRVMIERYPGGAVALMQAQGAVLKQRDEFGESWARVAKRRTAWSAGGDDLVMLKVRNSSPEPDGSFKDYWLRVPPESRTARWAVAWTFGMAEKQYQPEAET